MLRVQFSCRCLLNLPRLTDLDFSRVDKITDESLYTIGNIHGLSSLGLNGCKDITDGGVHPIIVEVFVPNPIIVEVSVLIIARACSLKTGHCATVVSQRCSLTSCITALLCCNCSRTAVFAKGSH